MLSYCDMSTCLWKRRPPAAPVQQASLACPAVLHTCSSSPHQPLWPAACSCTSLQPIFCQTAWLLPVPCLAVNVFFYLLARLQYRFCHIECLPTSVACLVSAKFGPKAYQLLFPLFWRSLFVLVRNVDGARCSFDFCPFGLILHIRTSFELNYVRTAMLQHFI